LSAEHDTEVEEALATVPRPAARAEFRRELRRRFLDGAGASSARGRSFGKPFIALLAAVAVLAAGYFLMRPSGPSWRVLHVAPDSLVKADGQTLPIEDPAALARDLRNAREILVETGDLVLQVGDLSLFDLGEGTRVAFAGFDDPGTSATYEVRASSGRLRARTGPGFAGRRMRVQADVMAAVITGTAFAVDYEAEGTCICCLHGIVEIASDATGPDPRAIEPRRMCFVSRADHEALWGDPPPSHAQPLQSLEARAREIWR